MPTGNTSSHWHGQNQDGSAGITDSNAIYSVRDSMPQKYATLPRNHNPFEVGDNGLWKTREQSERIENVEVLKRKAWKKVGKSMNDYGRSCSYGNLRSANPFSTDPPGENNPFNSYCRDK